MKYPIRASKVDVFCTKSYCVYDARKLKHKMFRYVAEIKVAVVKWICLLQGGENTLGSEVSGG